MCVCIYAVIFPIFCFLFIYFCQISIVEKLRKRFLRMRLKANTAIENRTLGIGKDRTFSKSYYFPLLTTSDLILESQSFSPHLWSVGIFLMSDNGFFFFFFFADGWSGFIPQAFVYYSLIRVKSRNGKLVSQGRNGRVIYCQNWLDMKKKLRVIEEPTPKQREWKSLKAMNKVFAKFCKVLEYGRRWTALMRSLKKSQKDKMGYYQNRKWIEFRKIY